MLVQIEEDGVRVADVQRLLLVHSLQSLLLAVAVFSARVQQRVLQRAALLVFGQLDLTCAEDKRRRLAEESIASAHRIRPDTHFSER